MKKVTLALLLVICLLAPTCLADLTLDFSTLTDAELQYILNEANGEIEKRNIDNGEVKSNESAIFDTTAYNEFDYYALYRRPMEHIGEQYVVSGRLAGLSLAEGSNDAGYAGLWLHYRGMGGSSEYVLLWTDPLEFNLLEDDWLEVYGTIIKYGALSEYSDGEVFYLHVDALNVYDGEGGSLIETTILPE